MLLQPVVTLNGTLLKRGQRFLPSSQGASIAIKFFPFLPSEPNLTADKFSWAIVPSSIAKGSCTRAAWNLRTAAASAFLVTLMPNCMQPCPSRNGATQNNHLDMNQDDESETRQREWEFTPIEFLETTVISSAPVTRTVDSTRDTQRNVPPSSGDLLLGPSKRPWKPAVISHKIRAT